MKSRSTSILLTSVILLISVSAFGDTYPKNTNIDIQHYQFNLWLSDKNDSIRAEATLTIDFKKNGIQLIRLDLTNVSAPHGKGMTVTRVMSEGKLLSYSHKSDELLITTPASVVGKQLSITVYYRGIPDAGLAIKQNRYNDRTFFSDNWPNLGHHWLPLVDHPSDKATCEFIVTAPAHYQVVSNGLEIQKPILFDDGNKLTHWKQSVPIAPWLFVLGVAEFAVDHVDSFDGKSIETWVYRQDREAGFYDFKTPTKQALTFFSEYVGPFAYEKLANIQSNNSTGGMEAASAIMYSERSVTGKRDPRWQDVIVHEVAHQWFGDAVTESDWDDVWLSEGFATYFTLLYTEHEKGRDEFVKGLKDARTQVVNHLAKNPDSPIVHNQLSDMNKVTSGLTYQKGAWVLHMLRELVGDANFKKGIQSYYKKYFNANASTTDFRNEMEQASGVDLKNFFAQWLYQDGMPNVKAQWTYDDKKRELKVTLEQTQPNSFSFPLEFGIFNGANKSPEIKKVNVTSTQSTFTFPLKSKPASVSLDPKTALLGVFYMQP